MINREPVRALASSRVDVERCTWNGDLGRMGHSMAMRKRWLAVGRGRSSGDGVSHRGYGETSSKGLRGCVMRVVGVGFGCARRLRGNTWWRIIVDESDWRET